MRYRLIKNNKANSHSTVQLSQPAQPAQASQAAVISIITTSHGPIYQTKLVNYIVTPEFSEKCIEGRDS